MVALAVEGRSRPVGPRRRCRAAALSRATAVVLLFGLALRCAVLPSGSIDFVVPGSPLALPIGVRACRSRLPGRRLARGTAMRCGPRHVEVRDPDNNEWYPALVEKRFEDGSCMASYTKDGFMYTSRVYGWRTRLEGFDYLLTTDSETCDDEEAEEYVASEGRVRHPENEFKVGEKYPGVIVDARPGSLGYSYFVDIGAERQALVAFRDNTTRLAGEELDVYFMFAEGGKLRVSAEPLKNTFASLKCGQQVQGQVIWRLGGPEPRYIVTFGGDRDALLHAKPGTPDGKLGVGDKGTFTITNIKTIPPLKITCHLAEPVELGQRCVGNVTAAGAKKGTFSVALADGRSGVLKDETSKYVVGQEVAMVVEAVGAAPRRIITLVREADRQPLADCTVGQRLRGQVVKKIPSGVFVDVGRDRTAFVRSTSQAKSLEMLDIRDFEVFRMYYADGPDPQYDLVTADAPGVDWRGFAAGQQLQATVVQSSPDFVAVGARAPFLLNRLMSTGRLEVGQTIPVWVAEVNDTTLRLVDRKVTRQRSELKEGMKLRGEILEVRENSCLADIGCGTCAIVELEKDAAAFSVGQEVDMWVRHVKGGKILVSTQAPVKLVPLGSIQAGQSFQGTVIHTSEKFFLVDIQSTKPAILGRSPSSARLSRGDRVPVVVTSATAKRIVVGLERSFALSAVRDDQGAESVRAGSGTDVETSSEVAVASSQGATRSQEPSAEVAAASKGAASLAEQSLAELSLAEENERPLEAEATDEVTELELKSHGSEAELSELQVQVETFKKEVLELQAVLDSDPDLAQEEDA